MKSTHQPTTSCALSWIMQMVYSFYLLGGDLLTQINMAKGHYIEEKHILTWFIQILLALKHVHDKRVLHRDLKCQNIFLTKSGIVKLGDFGIAKSLSCTNANAESVVGTPFFLAPEIIRSKPYSFEADIWALGVVLYQLCSLKPPFMAANIHGLALKIVKADYSPIPPFYSTELKTLISQLLVVEPSKRIKLNHILSINNTRNSLYCKKIKKAPISCRF